MKPTKISFSNFPKVCEESIARIVTQDFQRDVVVGSVNLFNSEQLSSHLKVIANYLSLITMGAFSNPKSVATGKKLEAFDLVNFFMKSKDDLRSHNSSEYASDRAQASWKADVCQMAQAKDQFIQDFAKSKNLGISEEAMSDYKTYFRASSRRLIEELSEFAIKCDYDGSRLEFPNYFAEVNLAKEKLRSGQPLTLLETVKAQSYLQQRLENLASNEKGRKRSPDEMQENPRLFDGVLAAESDAKQGFSDNYPAAKRKTPTYSSPTLLHSEQVIKVPSPERGSASLSLDNVEAGKGFDLERSGKAFAALSVGGESSSPGSKVRTSSGEKIVSFKEKGSTL